MFTGCQEWDLLGTQGIFCQPFTVLVSFQILSASTGPSSLFPEPVSLSNSVAFFVLRFRRLKWDESTVSCLSRFRSPHRDGIPLSEASLSQALPNTLLRWVLEQNMDKSIYRNAGFLEVHCLDLYIYIQKGVRVNPHALQDETLQRQPQDTNDTVHRPNETCADKPNHAVQKARSGEIT